MFTILKNAFKVKALKDKLIFMVLMLFIIRIGTHLFVPGIDVVSLNSSVSLGGFSLYSIITGGSLGTVFSLGIAPYITSSIIMQLLTVAIPRLEQINKEGEEGRKKINNYTRILAFILAFLQGVGQVYLVKSAFIYKNNWSYLVALVSMVSGTIFLMWLGERLTEKGIGNGTSFIIFTNIISSLPSTINTLYVDAVGMGTTGIVKIAIISILFVL